MSTTRKHAGILWLAAALLIAIAADVEAALVAYYPLDGDAAAVIGPSGTINGTPALVVGAVGTALDFNGSSDFIDVGAGVMPGGSYSIAAWVKPDLLSGIGYVGGVQTSGNNGGRLFRFDNAVPQIQQVTTPIFLKTGSAVSTGSFVHLAATFNDETNELRFYQNGVEVGSAVSATANANLVFANFKIGRRPDTSANFFNGVIDDVAVYSHALSPAEVATIATSGVLALEAQRSQTGPLGRQPYAADVHTLHLYHLDETSGSYMDAGVGVARHLDLIGGTRGTFAAAGLGRAFTVTTSDLGNNALVKGASTAASEPQSLYQGSDGAFTYEALVSLSTLQVIASEESQIVSRESDGANTARSFQFRVANGSLQFVGLNNSGVQTIGAAIPTSGDHAFVPNEWFHVAVTYDGDPADPQNLKLYWTSLDSGATVANLIGTGQLTADLAPNETGIFSIGSMRRGAYRTPLLGSIDEVRISDIARAPGDFLLRVPEPGSFVPAALGLLGLAALAGRRRRKA